MPLDPTPTHVPYEPRTDSVYPCPAAIKPQPEHDPAVLAKAITVPPGATSKRGDQPAFWNVTNPDGFSAKLDADRRARRRRQQEAARAAQQNTTAATQPKVPRGPKQPSATSTEGRVLALLRAARRPKTYSELAHSLTDLPPATVSSAAKRALQWGRAVSRVFAYNGKAGRYAEYWLPNRRWPDMETYRPNTRIVRQDATTQDEPK